MARNLDQVANGPTGDLQRLGTDSRIGGTQSLCLPR